MRKYVLLTGVALVMTAVSCKRCYRCVVRTPDGTLVSGYASVCVNKKDFEAYKDVCISNLDSNQVCDCSEDLNPE